MGIVTDFTAYGVATAKISAEATATLATLLGEVIPTTATQVRLIPRGTVYWNVGAAATASTLLLPTGGLTFGGNLVALNSVQLYAAAATDVDVIIGGAGLRVSDSSGISASLEVNLGNVGLLTAAEAEINPAAAYAEDTAHVTADWLTPSGAVRTDTRASLAGTTGDYAPLQLTANGDLRARDDDGVALLTTIDADTSKIPALGTAAMAASAPVTIATDDTQFGATTAAASADSGGVHAQLHYIADNVATAAKQPALGTAAMAASAPVTLATDDTQTGAVGAASDVDGNLHGQLRYIGEAVDNLPAAVGSGAMAASMPVTIATDDTQFAKLTGSAMTYGDAVVNAAAGAQTAIVAAPGAGKQIWVMGYDVSAGVAAGTWHWESANTDKYTAKEVGVNGGSVRQSSNPQSPLFKCGTNEALNITTVTCTIKGGVSYFVVTV